MKSKHKHNGRQRPLFGASTRDVYRDIRNYLAGRLVGATRDAVLMEEVIKCLFCRIHLTRQRLPSTNGWSQREVRALYTSVLTELQDLLPESFANRESFLLDDESLAFVDAMLTTINLEDWSSDPFGDVYEAFTGSSVRGHEGQFFTPLNAVELLVSMVNPMPGERVIDPACGSGGFLSAVARRWVAQGIDRSLAAGAIFGIDKDRYLAGLSAAHLSFVTLTSSNVFCADSLSWTAENGQPFALQDQFETFDVVLTNPPFGAKIVAASDRVKQAFDLAHHWKVDRATSQYVRQPKLQTSVPPQVLFIERCLSLVRSGGRIGIVVPESLVSGKNYRYVVDYVRTRATIEAVVGMPESLFKTSGKGGTHTKTCLLMLTKSNSAADSAKNRPIFMSEVMWCGNDSRGRRIDRDELPAVGRNYQRFVADQLAGADHLGYAVRSDQLVDNILAPRYYNPDVAGELQLLSQTHDLIRLGDLIDAGLVRITTGHEIGKLAYGSGPIPFVRTSDISNWEIKIDPKHCVSEEVYTALATKQDVQAGDILMVRDGTYLIGTCAIITEHDTRIVYQSHLYKLRITDHAKLSPFLLLAALSSAPVRRQIKALRFTQDIIDSLGDRVREIVLPLPRDPFLRDRIAEMVRQAVRQRIEARELSRRACAELVGDLERVADDPGVVVGEVALT